MIIKAVTVTLALICALAQSHAQDFSADELAKRAVERRAVEAAIWGMPIVAFDAMRQAFLRDAVAQYNDIVYWSKQADWRFQVTTPNASSWYVYVAINTQNGPVVLEIPPAEGAGLFGSMNDAWQIPRSDVGPNGADQERAASICCCPPGTRKRFPPVTFPFASTPTTATHSYVPFQ